MNRLVSIISFFAAFGVSVSAPAEDYGAAFDRARALEEEGRPQQALRVLEPLAESYPRDYSLSIRLGELFLETGEHVEAERYYRTAYAVKSDSVEAMLGLGCALLHQERYVEAQRLFVRVRTLDPANASAAEGLAAAQQLAASRPDWSFGFIASAMGEVYRHDAGDTPGGGPTLGLRARHGAFSTAASYRYLLFDGPAPGPRVAATENGPRRTGQHEAHFHLRWRRPTWTASIHYGGVYSMFEALPGANMAGAIGVLRLLGEATLETSVTQYDDGIVVWRVAPGWEIPLGEYAFIRPAGGYQRAADRDFFSGRLSTGLASESFELVLGAKMGDELRPTYLTEPAIHNLHGVVRLGGEAQVRVILRGKWSVSAGYELTRHASFREDTSPTTRHAGTVTFERRVW